MAAVLAAAALWGSTGTAAHFAPAGASAVSIGSARIVLAGVILVTIALRRRPGEFWQALRRGGPQRAGLAIGVVGVAGYQICFFSAVRLTGVAIGTMVAIGSAPVFVGLLSRLTGTSTLSVRWFAATAGAIAGCSVLLVGGPTAGVNLAGAGLALLAGLCYGCYAVAAARLITDGVTGEVVMAIMFGGAAVLLLPVLLAGPVGWLLTVRGAAVVLELGVFATAVAYLLYGYGLRTVPVPAAATLGLAEPVVATLLAVLVVGERLTRTAIAGLLLVACALAVLAAPSGGHRDRDSTASSSI